MTYQDFLSKYIGKNGRLINGGRTLITFLVSKKGEEADDNLKEVHEDFVIFETFDGKITSCPSSMLQIKFNNDTTA